MTAARGEDFFKLPEYDQSVLKEIGFDIETGFYKLGDDIVKVVKSKTTKRKYGKVLAHQPDSERDNKFVFEYRAGIIRQLRPEMQLTEAEAAEFGQKFGICCICGTELTNEESVELGIGPICRTKMGWK